MVKGSSSGGSYYTYIANDQTEYVYIASADTTISLAKHVVGTTFKVHPVFTPTCFGGDSSGSTGVWSPSSTVTVEEPVTSGGNRITSFGSGVLTISGKYTLSGGMTAADVQVYYLTDKGDLLCHDTSYSGGSLTFTTDHLSKFVIGTKSMMAVFADVSVKAWYAETVKYVNDSGLMLSFDGGEFAPDTAINRAMVVTVLYRMEGEPNAVAGESFTDAGQISSWALDAMKWANGTSLINGTSSTTLTPGGRSTRAQFAAILMRYCENIV